MNHDMERFNDIPANTDCLGMLSSLGDETDPLLLRVVDRARRRDGLLPTARSIESGPLAATGNTTALFFDGGATDEDFLLAHVSCEELRKKGNAAERELAALSLAILEASSIIYRRRLVVSESAREADARLAAAAAGVPSAWARLIDAAMRMPIRASA